MILNSAQRRAHSTDNDWDLDEIFPSSFSFWSHSVGCFSACSAAHPNPVEIWKRLIPKFVDFWIINLLYAFFCCSQCYSFQCLSVPIMLDEGFLRLRRNFCSHLGPNIWMLLYLRFLDPTSQRNGCWCVIILFHPYLWVELLLHIQLGLRWKWLKIARLLIVSMGILDDATWNWNLRSNGVLSNKINKPIQPF